MKQYGMLGKDHSRSLSHAKSNLAFVLSQLSYYSKKWVMIWLVIGPDID